MIKILIGIVVGLGIAFWYMNYASFTVNVGQPQASSTAENTISSSTAEIKAATSEPVVTDTETNSATDVPPARSSFMPETIPTILGPYPIVGEPEYKASGIIEIFEDGASATLHYEDFKTVNGPDLFVYLATDKTAKDFISLGRLKDTNGDFNYDIPEGTDLSKYKYVLVWCKPLGELFNSALIK